LILVDVHDISFLELETNLIRASPSMCGGGNADLIWLRGCRYGGQENAHLLMGGPKPGKRTIQISGQMS
jgi:hypothetical protein